MDFQPSSLLSRVFVCSRLELHDRLADPCRSRDIPHMLACGRTPEILNPITSHLGHGPRRLVQNLAVALGVAPILLGVSVNATSNPYAVSRGFPFSVAYVIPGCFGPGSPLGCLAYDPLGVVLDYLFWAGLSFGILTLARWIRVRGT